MSDQWTRTRPADGVDWALLLAVALVMVVGGGFCLLVGLVWAQDAVRVCQECRR